MAGRRILGWFMLILVVLAAVLVLWYIGSQKTVYSMALSFR